MRQKAIEPPQTPEERIVKHLEENGQKMSWLAKKIGLSPGYLHSILKGKTLKDIEGEITLENIYKITKKPLIEEVRKKINEALRTDY